MRLVAAFSVLVLAASVLRPSLAQEPPEPGAKGDQQRHYHFAEAGTDMPYRLYVPASYDPARKMPLDIV